MTQVAVTNKHSIQQKLADRFGVAPDEVAAILKNTAFRTTMDGKGATDAQMVALMIVADQYGLNPFVKELYAYPDKNNGIVPVVSVDGWSRIMNEHPQFDGIEFRYSEEASKHNGRTAYEWIECIIHRKDRKLPTIVREYFDEVVRKANFSTPWDTHPKRMHRHKTQIQCARIAFGFAGIYDDDEAARILEIDAEGNVVGQQVPESGAGNTFMPKKAEAATVKRQADEERTIDVVVKEKPAADKGTDPAPAAQEQPKQTAQTVQQTGGADEPKLTEGMVTTIRNKMKNSSKTDEAFVEEYAMRLEDAPRSMVNSFLKWAAA